MQSTVEENEKKCHPFRKLCHLFRKHVTCSENMSPIPKIPPPMHNTCCRRDYSAFAGVSVTSIGDPFASNSANAYSLANNFA